ncbi:MAG: MFS transporter [Coriobacteriia bacterium]|nr:MFS transporter [Coriobacteriia bacterium]MCL2749631.1 MFS transporter [Coriobacteriia bacterium]
MSTKRNGHESKLTTVVEKQKGTFWHYMIIVSLCVMVFFSAGLTLSVGALFFTPISETLGVGLGQVAMWLTIALLTATVVLPFAGKLIATKDARFVISAAVACIGLGNIIISFASIIWIIYVAAVFLGVGFSVIIYLSLPTMVNRWFKERAGFWLGICAAFTGIAGVIFNPVAGYLIEAIGWNTTYLVFGIAILVCVLPFTLLGLRNSPTDVNLLPFGEVLTRTDADNESPVTAPAVMGVSYDTARKSLAFFVMLLCTACIQFGIGIWQMVPSYASSLPLAASVAGLAAIIAACCMAGQAIGKVVLGAVIDKSVFGGLILSALCGGGGLLLFWLFDFSSIALYAGGFIFGFFYASAVVLVAQMTLKMFGVRDYARIYSRISMVSALLGALSISIWGFIVQFGSFLVLWLGGLALVALIILLGFVAINAAKKLPQTSD